MQYIECKDIFYLLRDMLKMFDRRPIVHGGKVAYYVYMMLKQKGKLEQKKQYEDYELADIVFLTTFHDIGAYKTENIDQMIRYETKDVRAHSLYGKLFLEKLTLYSDLAGVILNHHTDYATLSKSGFEHNELASYINLAEAIDIFKESLGEKFSLEIFKKNVGTKFSPQAFDLFCKADEEYNLFEKVSSGAYKEEISKLMDSFILSNEEKEKYLELLMFTISLKSDIMMDYAARCVALCEKLGILMKLNDVQRTNLQYAAYVHDIGYMAFRQSWIENPTKLSAAHLEKVAQHTILMEQLLKDRMKREVIIIAAAHHERVDGKGYPRRLTEKQMNLSQLILQFSDMVATMMTTAYKKEKVIEKVKRQTESGCFSPVVSNTFIEKFDEIAEYTKERSNEILKNLKVINEQYENIKPR